MGNTEFIYEKKDENMKSDKYILYQEQYESCQKKI